MITNILRRLAMHAVALLTVVSSAALMAQQTGDMLFKAMQDELDRNMGQLVMQDLEKPYFISYTIDDNQQLEITGELGTLTRSSLDRSRYLTVDVRVGDYSLDNSNFVSGYQGFGSDYSPLSIDDNYDAVRNQIYLATDAGYKDALETLSKKRAYLQTRVIPNRPDDFIKLPPNRYLDKPQVFDIKKATFEELAKGATAVFRDYPAIISADLKVTAFVSNQYLVNSNGSHTERGDRIYGFELTMTAKSGEGDDIIDGDRIIIKDVASLPTLATLTSWAKTNADRMVGIIKADTLDEYTGPVILSGEAAGEFLRQLFVKNVSNIPSPLYENDQMASMMGGGGADFAGKLFRKVLPQTFSVYDDPTISKVGNTPVIGGYAVDDAGGVPQRITLVEKGKLVSLPVGITPSKKVKDPNGHARGAVGKDISARSSNMVFTSTEKVPYAQLKQDLINMCKEVDLPYGLIVRRLRDLGAQGSGGFSFYRPPSQNQGVLTEPYEIYKVYTDGREEPARNLQFNNVTVRILKDIQQTDDQAYVYNYLIGNDYEMPASIVTPSLLIEEMELKKSEEKVKKPPLLPSPLTEK